MTEAIGPIFAAGDEIVSKSGYVLVYLPDVNNAQLQREGKPPVYYWLPNSVRLARKEGSNDAKFMFIHMVGVRSDQTSVGVEGKQEVSGGLLGFSTTAAPPSNVLQEAHEELLNRFRGKDDYYWGWRTPAAPMFRPVPIVSNTTSITNLGGQRGGHFPVVGPRGSRNNGRGHPRDITMGGPPAPVGFPRSVPLSRSYRNTNLDLWYFNLQGQGPGSVSPVAENAYSGLVGSLPAALIWQSFHGGTGGLSVWQHMKIKVWSPIISLKIEGDWNEIQSHYSAAAHAEGWWWSADIQAEFNNLEMNGAIKVTMKVDSTLPDAAKLEETLEKQKSLIIQKFMDQAQKTIFDPAPFNEEAAKASGGGLFGWGGGLAFKLRRDTVNLHLNYEEEKQMAYLQDFPISGQLDGLRDEILADPAAEKKYFQTLYLADWERKVRRTVTPVVNWPDPTQKWVGQPVAFLSAQVGYPNTEGVVQWDGARFDSGTGDTAVWDTAVEMKAAADVNNAPAGWKPDMTFVKRRIHFTEPPNETENPFARVIVERNEVDLDPGELGTLTSDINLDVRVDTVGMLNVGPIFLDVDLENAKQVVEVTFQAQGKNVDGHDRAPVKFSWQFADYTQPRFWMMFTGQPDYVPRYQYQVRVIVKGTLFSAGMEWVGPWVDAAANGPIMVSVPTPQDDGVRMRSFSPVTAGAGTTTSGTSRPPATTSGTSRPPATTSGTSRPPATTSGRTSGPPPTTSRSKMTLSEKMSRARGYGEAMEGGESGWTTMPRSGGWTTMRPASGSQKTKPRGGPTRTTSEDRYAEDSEGATYEVESDDDVMFESSSTKRPR